MPFRRVALIVGIFVAGWGPATLASDGGPVVIGSTYTFVTVDSVTAQADSIFVTGILKGEAEATTHSVEFYVFSGDHTFAALMVSACERKALLAMTKPGQYLLVLQDSPGASQGRSSCTLTRVNP